jgi:cell division protein FtsW
MLSIIMLLLGLIVIYSISPGLAAGQGVSENYYVSKQLIAIGLGMVAFIITANISYTFWNTIEKPLILCAAFAAVAVRLFGDQVNGAYRWVQIGGMSFQAVELIKFVLLIWLAGFLVQRMQEHSLGDYQKTLKPLAIGLGGVAFVVAVLQSDLGSTGVILSMSLAMCFVAGLPLKRIVLFIGIATIGVVFAVSSTPYRRDRLATYLHPERDCEVAGYQACQALIAVGSGGVFGKGVAHSVQAYGYLPEAANDSIFAIFAEKFGFFGTVVLLVISMVFFWRLKSIMERAPDNVSRLILVGILAWLSTQMFINMGAMLGILPLKGITLPFISYGGTSIIFVMACVGLAFNISRYTVVGRLSSTVTKTEGRTYEGTIDRRRDRRTYNAPVSRRPGA